jgi:hypothetical protein
MRPSLLPRISALAAVFLVSRAWAQAPPPAPPTAADVAPAPPTPRAEEVATGVATPPVAEPVDPPAAKPPPTADAGGLPETSDADGTFATDAASASSMMVGEDTPKLELYGFADFSYLHTFGADDNVLRHYVGPYPRFYVGHLNLYLSSTLGDNWRSLAEVRFTYSPQGDEDRAAPDGTFPVTDTGAVDYAELQRTFSWGGIEIQRAWIEYQPFDFLSIRGGHWLTPYGFWNDDHGSPTIIAVHKPFPIGDAFFPEHQTGLVAHGKYFVGSAALGYSLTLSNGRGPYDVVRDLDANKAVGGRAYLETSAVGNLTIGVDVYRGRYTTSTKRYRVDASNPDQPIAVLYRTTDAAYDELSLGANVRFLWKGLHVQGELMSNEAAYDDEARPRTEGFDPRPAFAADYRRIGGYLLLGYRTPWLSIMPYVMGEHSSYDNSDLAPPVWAWSAGLNLRPTPNVVLKAELAIADFEGTGSTGLGKHDLPYFGAQVAWAF